MPTDQSQLAHAEVAADGAAAPELPILPVSRIPSSAGLTTRLAYRHAKTAGITLRPLLQRSHLTVNQVEDRDQRISVRDQIEFLNAVAESVGDDRLGFHLAQHVDLREIGLLYYVCASSETLAEVFRRGARYGSIVNEGAIQRYTEGATIGISPRYVGVSRHLDRHQIEFWMTVILRLVRQLTGTSLVPQFVRLIHARTQGCDELDAYFGCVIEFGAQADELAFPRAAGTLACGHSDPFLNRLLVRYCEEMLVQRQTGRSLQSEVENALVPLLPHGNPGSRNIAKRLGISQRTFARRLAQEGQTYSGVLNRLRYQLSSRYLAEAGLSISRIAWLLGYQEVAAFSRAFRRWTGRSPSAAASRLRPARPTR